MSNQHLMKCSSGDASIQWSSTIVGNKVANILGYISLAVHYHHLQHCSAQGYCSPLILNAVTSITFRIAHEVSLNSCRELTWPLEKWLLICFSATIQNSHKVPVAVQCPAGFFRLWSGGHVLPVSAVRCTLPSVPWTHRLGGMMTSTRFAVVHWRSFIFGRSQEVAVFTS